MKSQVLGARKTLGEEAPGSRMPLPGPDENLVLVVLQPATEQNQRNDDRDQEGKHRTGLSRRLLQLRQAPSEQISQTPEERSPTEAACDVVQRESSVGHAADAGQHGGPHSQEGDEPPEEHGLATVPLEEPMRTLERRITDV